VRAYRVFPILSHDDDDGDDDETSITTSVERTNREYL